MILFGYAIRTDVRPTCVSPSSTRAPDDATLALRAASLAPASSTSAVVPRAEDLDRLFQSGAVQEAIVFEPGFAVASALAALRPSCWSSPTRTDPNTASLLQSYARAVVAGYVAGE